MAWDLRNEFKGRGPEGPFSLARKMKFAVGSRVWIQGLDVWCTVIHVKPDGLRVLAYERRGRLRTIAVHVEALTDDRPPVYAP